MHRSRKKVEPEHEWVCIALGRSDLTPSADILRAVRKNVGGTTPVLLHFLLMSDRNLEDARKAFLFVNSSGSLTAVTLDRDGRNLPHPAVCRWTFAKEFQLGVQEVIPFGVDPEPILRGVAANGYFVWPVENILPFGTSQ